MAADPVFLRDLAYVFLAALLGGGVAWRGRQRSAGPGSIRSMGDPRHGSGRPTGGRRRPPGARESRVTTRHPRRRQVPTRTARTASHPQHGVASASSCHDAASPKVPTVMVIDDDADSRELLRQMIESIGARVILAQDGQDALTRLATTAPDLIFCDLRMPRMDGFAFLKRARQIPQRGAPAGGRCHRPRRARGRPAYVGGGLRWAPSEADRL